MELDTNNKLDDHIDEIIKRHEDMAVTGTVLNTAQQAYHTACDNYRRIAHQSACKVVGMDTNVMYVRRGKVVYYDPSNYRWLVKEAR